MKRPWFYKLWVLVFLIYLSVPSPGFPVEQVPGLLFRVARVKAAALNLRQGQGTKYTVLEVLKKGSMVFYMPQSRKDWVRVTTRSGLQGWASLKFLQTKQSRRLIPALSRFELPERKTEANILEEGTYAVVRADALNVRSGPGTEFPVVKTVRGGTHLFPLTRTDDYWERIQIPQGPEGWVARKYLRYYNPALVPDINQLTVPNGYTSSLEAGVVHFLEDLYQSEHLNREDRLSMVVQDLTTGKQHVSIRPRKRVKSASLIKVPVFQAFLLQRFNQKIRHSNTTQKHLEQMIRFSSNESTNHILRALGGPARVWNILGSTGMYHELMLVEYIPKDGRTYRNKISASDLNQIFARLWFGRVLGPEHSYRLT